MSGAEAWEVVLFQSVSQAIRAEKLLAGAGVSCKLIPVPRHLSSDCGVCLRFVPACRLQVEAALRDRVPFEAILPLQTGGQARLGAIIGKGSGGTVR